MDGWITIGTKINNDTLEKQIKNLEEELEALRKKYEEIMNDPKADPKKIKEYQQSIKLAEKELDGLKKKQTELNVETQGFDNSFDKSIKKVGKLALGIFSIRSAYMLIRQATNQLAQQNDELAQKLSTIRGSLSNLLAPAIEWIVDKVYTLLGYLNTITKTFFGIDLFKKSSKSAQSTAKSAKEIKKQLAGFDEMNILNDNKTSGGGGSGSSGNVPEPKVSSNWQKTIEDYKEMWDEILKIDHDEAVKLLKSSDKNWGQWKAGIFEVEQGVVKILNGFATGDLGQVKDGVLEFITGLLRTFVGFFEGIIKSVANFGVEVGKEVRNIIDSVVKIWTNSFEFFWGIIKKIGSTISNFFKTTWDGLKDLLKSIKNGVKDRFNEIKTSITGVIDKIKTKFTELKSHAKTVWDGIKTSMKAPINVMIGWLNKVIDGLNKLKVDIPDWVPGFGGQKWGFNIKKIPTLAQGGIVNNPGRGVNMGSYIAGEKGAEAVLPLTDDTLQRLANMIPININLTNTMNGRVISRELQKVRGENSFANNW